MFLHSKKTSRRVFKSSLSLHIVNNTYLQIFLEEIKDQRQKERKRKENEKKRDSTTVVVVHY
jgi:hypothetical protein